MFIPTNQITHLILQQVFQSLSDHLREEDITKQINLFFLYAGPLFLLGLYILYLLVVLINHSSNWNWLGICQIITFCYFLDFLSNACVTIFKDFLSKDVDNLKLDESYLISTSTVFHMCIVSRLQFTGTICHNKDT